VLSGVVLSSSSALVPEKRIVPAMSVMKAGARKPSAEPSAGASVVGATPLATMSARADIWLDVMLT